MQICKCHLMTPTGLMPTGLCFTLCLQANLKQNSLLKKQPRHRFADREEVLIAIPQSIGSLHEAVLELWCLDWVEENTLELVGDATARRELRARRTEAEREVSEQLTALFGGNIASPQVQVGFASDSRDNAKNCLWYHSGRPTPIASRRALNEYLSTICDSVYSENTYPSQ